MARSEELLQRRRVKRMFGDAAKRQPDQSACGHRETLALMDKCAKGKDRDLQDALCVGKMTVQTVLDAGYYKKPTP